MTLKKDNWGNQELPGISNEELLSDDFAKKVLSAEQSERSKLLATDPQWIAIHENSIKKRNQDPEYHKKRNEALSKKYQDPVWKENIQKGADKRHADPTWQKAWKDSYTPESNKRRSETCKKILNTPEAKARASNHSTALWQNEEHRIKIQKCVKTNLGVFPSCKEAATAHGQSVANFGTSMKRKKNILAGWRFISREEYDKIKG